MSKVLILGATGSLGRYVTQQAIAANHEVSAVVRTPSKLPAEVRERVVVHQADLAATCAADLAAILQGHDAVINAAGLVTEGQGFVDLVARVLSGLELPEQDRPVCWFLAGAALLDLDIRGRRGVDLARIAATYWPHRANYDRTRQTALD
jgi:putative NADH-flavin reductase